LFFIRDWVIHEGLTTGIMWSRASGYWGKSEVCEMIWVRLSKFTTAPDLINCTSPDWSSSDFLYWCLQLAVAHCSVLHQGPPTWRAEVLLRSWLRMIAKAQCSNIPGASSSAIVNVDIWRYNHRCATTICWEIRKTDLAWIVGRDATYFLALKVRKHQTSALTSRDQIRFLERNELDSRTLNMHHIYSTRFYFRMYGRN